MDTRKTKQLIPNKNCVYLPLRGCVNIYNHCTFLDRISKKQKFVEFKV